MRHGVSRAAVTAAAALILLPLLGGCGLLAEPADASVALVDSGQLTGLSVETTQRDITRAVGAEVRELPTTIWYPVGVSGQSFPLLLLSHGLHGAPENYFSLATALASAGFIVAAPAYPGTTAGGPQDLNRVVDQPADARAVLDAVLADSELAPLIDAEHIGALGHSAGGMTTIGLLVGEKDERIDAAVVLAGNAYRVGHAFEPGGSPVPMLFIHPDDDARLDISGGRIVFDAVPWPSAFLTLSGGGHSAPFKDTTIPQFGTARDSTIAFFRWALEGEQDGYARLLDGIRAPDLLDDRLGPSGETTTS